MVKEQLVFRCRIVSDDLPLCGAFARHARLPRCRQGAGFEIVELHDVLGAGGKGEHEGETPNRMRVMRPIYS